MGFEISDKKTLSPNTHKTLKKETNVTKVALWQLPYDSRYADYDTDNTSWFESQNKLHNNEIKKAERALKISLKEYEVRTRKLEYDDKSVTEISKYPNGNIVKTSKTNDYVSVEIRDKSGQVTAQKFYNYSSKDGRKIVYKNITKGGDTFTIVRIFSYDRTKNKSTDIINYGYTSQEANFIGGSSFEKEYYTLNGKEVKAELNDKNEYCVKNEQGKTVVFAAE